MKKVIYGVYTKNDEVICIGTSKECAECLNMSIDSFYSQVTNFRKGIVKGRKHKYYKLFVEEAG